MDSQIIGIIYLIENQINGKKYVGMTTLSLETRWKQHVNDAKKYKFAIHCAISKYGYENFKITKLSEHKSLDELCKAEILWIEKLQTHISFGRGYNMTIGGEGVKGHIVTDNQKEKMRISHTGKIFSKEHRKNISLTKLGIKNPMFGKQLSKEHKDKISVANKGKNVTEKTRKKISTSLTGKKSNYVQKSCRKVLQISKETNEILNTFKSIHDAARSISQIASASNILYCCNNVRKQAYGFIWKFAE